MLAERQRSLELLLERVDAQRLEPPRLVAEPRRIGEPLQRRAAPQRQRRRDRRPPRPASPSRNAPRASASSSSKRTASTRASLRAYRQRSRRSPRPERGAQAGDVMLHRVTRSRGQILPPQAVDQRRPRHDPPARRASIATAPHASSLPPPERPARETSNGPSSRISSGARIHDRRVACTDESEGSNMPVNAAASNALGLSRPRLAFGWQRPGASLLSIRQPRSTDGPAHRERAHRRRPSPPPRRSRPSSARPSASAASSSRKRLAAAMRYRPLSRAAAAGRDRRPRRPRHRRGTSADAVKRPWRDATRSSARPATPRADPRTSSPR